MVNFSAAPIGNKSFAMWDFGKKYGSDGQQHIAYWCQEWDDTCHWYWCKKSDDNGCCGHHA